MTRKKDDKWPIPSGYARIEPMMPNSDDLIKISEEAHHLGFITIKDLACILASDNSYEEKNLSACWNELQLNIRRKFPDDISTPEKRVSVWLSILERLTSKSIHGNRSGLKPILGLPGYKFIADEDKFIQDIDDPDYIKLDELEKYLIDTIKIPLPTLLFSREKEPAQEVRKKEEELVKAAWPETIRLYDVIKSVGFKGPDVELKLQNRAKSELKINSPHYSYIKRKYLNRKKLFGLNTGQEKRDFIGNLLKIIAKEHGIKKSNYQRLYEIGKTNSSNHK